MGRSRDSENLLIVRRGVKMVTFPFSTNQICNYQELFKTTDLSVKGKFYRVLRGPVPPHHRVTKILGSKVIV